MHEHIDFPGRSAVKIKVREMPHFTYPWHFHPEYELLYVIEGSGTSFVADSIEEFQSGDLAFIGSNLPHFWRSDEKYLNSNGKLKIKYVVIQFPQDFLHDSIEKYPEYNLIGELMERSAQGIRFSLGFTRKVSRLILRMSKLNGFQRIIALQELLQILAKTKEYRILAGEFYQHESIHFKSFRLNNVIQFLNTSYQRKIELEKVADIANLHPTAFCRFFKENTGKTLSEYVNDMRISYACRLIMEGKLTVSQISFESGFNNLSNFNRTFKKNTRYTPTQYFEKFHHK